jgi:CDP-paratose 2-epimerase
MGWGDGSRAGLHAVVPLRAPAVRMASPRIVVTGGAGFLGSNLVDRLAAAGESVLVYDNLSRPRVEENLAWLRANHPYRVDAAVADIRDADALADSVRGAKAVIHLAAQVAVTTSLEDPVADFEVNARGTLNVLEALRRGAPKAPCLFASTNKVYGELLGPGAVARRGERHVPLDARLHRGVGETTPLDLHSPYGCSKGAADQYVRDYARVYGLRTAVLRMSCIYGPRQFGTEDQGWVAHFLISALSGRPIVIYGDGRQVRDVLFIDDAVVAYLAVLERIDGVAGRVFNLGGGPQNTLSLLELARLIEAVTGIRPEMGYGGWRAGDQPWYVTDHSALTAATGWRPRVGAAAGRRPLARGLAEEAADRMDEARELLA